MTHVERNTPIVKIKFKTSMPHSTLYDFSDTYILVSGTITVVEAGADEAAKAADR